MNEDKLEKLITESLSEAGQKIKPPRVLLSKIITAVKSPVAGARQEKHIFTYKYFYASGFAVILLAVMFSFSSGFGFFHQSARVADQNINNQPLTSNDIDDAANAILASAADEDSNLSNDSSDSSANADSAAINNLIQSYDQEQF